VPDFIGNYKHAHYIPELLAGDTVRLCGRKIALLASVCTGALLLAKAGLVARNCSYFRKYVSLDLTLFNRAYYFRRCFGDQRIYHLTGVPKMLAAKRSG
jgi:hypothetical protein